jgi:hypothetical protein
MWMEVNSNDKLPSLLRYGNNYDRKKFYNSDPRSLNQTKLFTVTFDSVLKLSNALRQVFVLIYIFIA